jgi:hypothetical protein
MAVVWGGTISQPTGSPPPPAGGYGAVPALLFTVAAIIFAALLAVGALR